MRASLQQEVGGTKQKHSSRCGWTMAGWQDGATFPWWTS